MFGSLISSLTENLDGFRTKAVLYLIAGVAVIVILSVLLDGVRKYIRGLDTAALGALFIWLGYEAAQYSLTKGAAIYMLAAGGTMAVLGILIFIISRSFRRSRKRKAVVESGPPMPEKHLAKPEEDN